MDVSFAVVVVQTPDIPPVANLIVALEALDVLPIFCSVIIHVSFLFIWCKNSFPYISIYNFPAENFGWLRKKLSKDAYRLSTEPCRYEPSL